MRLKSNLYKDNYGNIFFSKTIQGKRIVLPARTKNPNTANKLHSLLEYHALKQFYEPKVNLPYGLLNWKDISPKSLEIAVAREIR